MSCAGMLWNWSRVEAEEADGVGGSQRWVEKGKGGHTMTVCQLTENLKQVETDKHSRMGEN